MSDFEAQPTTGNAASAQSKRDLRRERLAARQRMSEQSQKNQDYVVRATLVSWLAEIRPETVAAYVPMSGEPGGVELPNTLAAHVSRVLLPVVLPNRDLDWALFDGPGTVAPAALGLMEPIGPRLGPATISEADVVLVPALAVDWAGLRLGRGGGSYDRALIRVRSPQLVIALLYDGEFVESVPAEPHDRRVDGIVINGAVTMLSPGDETRPAGR